MKWSTAFVIVALIAAVVYLTVTGHTSALLAAWVVTKGILIGVGIVIFLIVGFLLI